MAHGKLWQDWKRLNLISTWEGLGLQITGQDLSHQHYQFDECPTYKKQNVDPAAKLSGRAGIKKKKFCRAPQKEMPKTTAMPTLAISRAVFFGWLSSLIGIPQLHHCGSGSMNSLTMSFSQRKQQLRWEMFSMDWKTCNPHQHERNFPFYISSGITHSLMVLWSIRLLVLCDNWVINTKEITLPP